MDHDKKKALLDRGELLYSAIMVGIVWPTAFGIGWLVIVALKHVVPHHVASDDIFQSSWISLLISVCMTIGGILGLRRRLRKAENPPNK